MLAIEELRAQASEVTEILRKEDPVRAIGPAGRPVDDEDPIRELGISDRLVGDRALLPGIER